MQCFCGSLALHALVLTSSTGCMSDPAEVMALYGSNPALTTGNLQTIVTTICQANAKIREGCASCHIASSNHSTCSMPIVPASNTPWDRYLGINTYLADAAVQDNASKCNASATAYKAAAIGYIATQCKCNGNCAVRNWAEKAHKGCMQIVHMASQCWSMYIGMTLPFICNASVYKAMQCKCNANATVCSARKPGCNAYGLQCKSTAMQRNAVHLQWSAMQSKRNAVGKSINNALQERINVQQCYSQQTICKQSNADIGTSHVVHAASGREQGQEQQKHKYNRTTCNLHDSGGQSQLGCSFQERGGTRCRACFPYPDGVIAWVEGGGSPVQGECWQIATAPPFQCRKDGIINVEQGNECKSNATGKCNQKTYRNDDMQLASNSKQKHSGRLQSKQKQINAKFGLITMCSTILVTLIMPWLICFCNYVYCFCKSIGCMLTHKTATSKLYRCVAYGALKTGQQRRSHRNSKRNQSTHSDRAIYVKIKRKKSKSKAKQYKAIMLLCLLMSAQGIEVATNISGVPISAHASTGKTSNKPNSSTCTSMSYTVEPKCTQLILTRSIIGCPRAPQKIFRWHLPSEYLFGGAAGAPWAPFGRAQRAQRAPKPAPGTPYKTFSETGSFIQGPLWHKMAILIGDLRGA